MIVDRPRVAGVFGAHCARGGTACGLFYKVTKIIEVSWDEYRLWQSGCRTWLTAAIIPDVYRSAKYFRTNRHEPAGRGVQHASLGLGKTDYCVPGRGAGQRNAGRFWTTAPPYMPLLHGIMIFRVKWES